MLHVEIMLYYNLIILFWLNLFGLLNVSHLPFNRIGATIFGETVRTRRWSYPHYPV